MCKASKQHQLCLLQNWVFQKCVCMLCNDFLIENIRADMSQEQCLIRYCYPQVTGNKFQVILCSNYAQICSAPFLRTRSTKNNPTLQPWHTTMAVIRSAFVLNQVLLHWSPLGAASLCRDHGMNRKSLQRLSNSGSVSESLKEHKIIKLCLQYKDWGRDPWDCFAAEHQPLLVCWKKLESHQLLHVINWDSSLGA